MSTSGIVAETRRKPGMTHLQGRDVMLTLIALGILLYSVPAY